MAHDSRVRRTLATSPRLIQFDWRQAALPLWLLEALRVTRVAKGEPAGARFATLGQTVLFAAMGQQNLMRTFSYFETVDISGHTCLRLAGLTNSSALIPATQALEQATRQVLPG